MRYEAADRWLKTRLQMPTELSSRGLSGIDPAVRAHCFFSARVAEGHVLDRLREVSDAFSRGEMDAATARLRLKRMLGGGFTPGGPEDRDLSRLASTARLDLILRQNARMAAAVGEYEQGRDPVVERMFPAWRYVQSTSAEPRASHAAYAGKVFLKSDPIWRRIFPPWDFGCKCSVEDVSAEELAEAGAEPETRPGDLPPAAGSGFEFDPAEAFRAFDMELVPEGRPREAAAEGLLESGADIRVGKREPMSWGEFTGRVSAKAMDAKDMEAVPDDEAKAGIARGIDRMLAEPDSPVTLRIGRVLPSHCRRLGLPDGKSEIVLRNPGTKYEGRTHWTDGHRDTFKGDAVVALLERTVWNWFARPFIDRKGNKTRLVYEWLDAEGNALCSLFELSKSGEWAVIDAWVPSDQYFAGAAEKRQKKRPAPPGN